MKYTNYKISPGLVRYLLNNDIMHLFIYNIERYAYRFDNSNTITTINDISTAFTWTPTKEGGQFWAKHAVEFNQSKLKDLEY